MQTINIERLRKLDYRANEAYKNLRTNIQLCGSDVKVIMFTSTTPGEGKSTVSFNLAVSLAEAGKKVIFIDADLRKDDTRLIHQLRDLHIFYLVSISLKRLCMQLMSRISM